MNWLIETTGIVQLENRSTLGKYRGLQYWESAIRKYEFEATYSTKDLYQLANMLGLKWDDYVNGQPATVTKKAVMPRGIPVVDKFKRAAHLDNLDNVLKAFLEDIAKVLTPHVGTKLATRDTLKRDNRELEWKLDDGRFDVFWLRPSSTVSGLRGLGSEPGAYTRLVIILKVGKVGKDQYNRFYQWSTRFGDANEFAVTAPLRTFGVTGVRQACGKVFIVEGNGGQCGIVKFEADKFINDRYDAIWYLYRLLFDSTPASKPFSPDDLAYLREINIPNGSKYIDEYETEAADFPKQALISFYASDAVIRKIEYCDIQESLQSRLLIAKAAADRDSGYKPYEAISALLFRKPQFQRLGRMAAVDYVTGNTDRLLGTSNNKDKYYVVTVKNIDFNSGGFVLAIDNTDQGSSLFLSTGLDGWSGREDILQPVARKKLAEKAVAGLVKQTGYWKNGYLIKSFVNDQTIKTCTAAFEEGLEAGVIAMQLIRARYEAKARNSNWWGPFAETICNRIDALKQ